MHNHCIPSSSSYSLSFYHLLEEYEGHPLVLLQLPSQQFSMNHDQHVILQIALSNSIICIKLCITNIHFIPIHTLDNSIIEVTISMENHSAFCSCLFIKPIEYKNSNILFC